ncbi:phosphoglycolate phosphatase [Flavobacteriaceae bacterium Ap0902]|nr:phosphoglycolate phosphatase [Flavobacteriaceae bacterium Ap0902]
MNILSNKKFIIFDLDGTLINSLPDIANAINHTFSQIGYKELSVEDVSTMIGNGVKLLIERALNKTTGEKPTLEEVQKTMDTYYNFYKNHVCVDTYLYPHVKETLEYLDQAGYDMVICTNKPIDFVEPIIEGLKIKSFFEDWIGEGSLEVKKPDPGPLFYLMEKFSFETQETVMVGDSKNDIMAAQNAGVDSIGLSYGYNYNESIADYNPTVVVNDFAEIQDLL